MEPETEAAAPRDAGPTPETLRKLRRDIVARLGRDGRLCAGQLRAALEIRRVWEAFGRGLFPAARPAAPIAQRRRRAMFTDPIDRLTPAEELAWRLRYRPWAREMAVTVAAGAVRTTRLQLILDVVIDNHGLRQVEGWYRMRHGSAVEHVRAALHRYAELAGWVDAPYPETRNSSAVRMDPAERTDEEEQENDDFG